MYSMDLKFLLVTYTSVVAAQQYLQIILISDKYVSRYTWFYEWWDDASHL